MRRQLGSLGSSNHYNSTRNQVTILQWIYEHITEIFFKVVIIVIMISMIRSCRKFAHVTTAELSWHVQDCDMNELLFLK